MPENILTSYIEIEGFSDIEYLNIAVIAFENLGWEISGFKDNTLYAALNLDSSAKGRLLYSIDKGRAIFEIDSIPSNNIFDNILSQKLKNFQDELESVYENTPDEDLRNDVNHTLEHFGYSISNDEAENMPRQPRQKPKSFIESITELLKPRKGYFVSPILMALNIAAFVVMVLNGVHLMNPTTNSLIFWGANLKELSLGGEPWRLITSTFLHGGIIHLLFNMYALAMIGSFLEPMIGRLRFTAAYFFAGLFASIASIWNNDMVVSVGASGAIFGMFGLFFVLLLTDLIPQQIRKKLISNIGGLLLINIAYGMMNPQIDNAAHIGGLISGALIGWLYSKSLRQLNNPDFAKKNLLLTISIMIIACFSLYYTIPSTNYEYRELLTQFSENEQKSVEVLSSTQDSSSDKFAEAISEYGIGLWEKNIDIVNRIKELQNLPEYISARIGLIEEYTNVKLEYFRIINKALEEDTEEYNDEIEEYQQKISELISKLNKKE